MTNNLKVISAIGSALVAAAASADVLPDGKTKHILITLGIAGTFLSALYAKVPQPAPDPATVDLAKIGKP